MEQEDEYSDMWTKAFLESIIDGKAFQEGDKGNVLLWGGIWNYFREEDFTPWLARLIEATNDEWETNIHLSWEHEQCEHRDTKVFWFSCRNQKLIWASIPRTQRMHWGECGHSGPIIGDNRVNEVILIVDGTKWPDHDTCRWCGKIVGKFKWEGDWRICPECDHRRPVLRAYRWKDEGDE